MNTTVLELDFTTASPINKERINFTEMVHTRENKASNEIILNGQRVRLANNCKIIYEALMRGERLNGDNIWERYRIREYRRRIKDLKDAGIKIEETTLKNGCKEWYFLKQINN